MFSEASKVQGAHRCHSMKKNYKTKSIYQNTSLASNLILQSQSSVDTAFTTISHYPPGHFILWEFIHLGTTISQQ